MVEDVWSRLADSVPVLADLSPGTTPAGGVDSGVKDVEVLRESSPHETEAKRVMRRGCRLVLGASALGHGASGNSQIQDHAGGAGMSDALPAMGAKSSAMHPRTELPLPKGGDAQAASLLYQEFARVEVEVARVRLPLAVPATPGATRPEV